MTRLLAPVAALCLFLMMALTFIEVIGRYFLSAPLSGGEEVKAFLLGFTVFTALPLVTQQQRHIAVRSLANMLRGRALFVQRTLVHAGTFVGIGFLGVLLWGQAQSLAEDGQATSYLNMPLAPPVYIFAVLAGVASLLALALLIRHFRGGGEAHDGHGAGPE